MWWNYCRFRGICQKLHLREINDKNDVTPKINLLLFNYFFKFHKESARKMKVFFFQCKVKSIQNPNFRSSLFFIYYYYYYYYCALLSNATFFIHQFSSYVRPWQQALVIVLIYGDHIAKKRVTGFLSKFMDDEEVNAIQFKQALFIELHKEVIAYEVLFISISYMFFPHTVASKLNCLKFTSQLREFLSTVTQFFVTNHRNRFFRRNWALLTLLVILISNLTL